MQCVSYTVSLPVFQGGVCISKELYTDTTYIYTITGHAKLTRKVSTFRNDSTRNAAANTTSKPARTICNWNLKFCCPIWT